MKRNFLLMLLLTLLPFAGWAVDVKVGDYTVTLDKQQYVALVDATTGVDAPAITKIAKGATEFTGTALGVYTKNGQVVNGKIKEAGVYYSFVKIDDNGSKTIQVPFRVYAETELAELNWARIVADESQETLVENTDACYENDIYDAVNVPGGAYWYYFKEYQWADIWVHMPQYPGGARGYVLKPGQTYDQDRMPVGAGYAQDNDGRFLDPDDDHVLSNDELNAWAQTVLSDPNTTDDIIAEHDWNAVRRTNANNIVFSFCEEQDDESGEANDVDGSSIIVFKYVNGDNALYATPWGDRKFGKSGDDKKYGLFGIANDFRNEFAWGTSEVPEFDDANLAIYALRYEELEGSVLDNNAQEQTIQVTPISGVRMPYGGEIDLSPANANNVITLTPIAYNTLPNLKQTIMEAGILQVNGIDGKTDPAVWKTLVPGSYTYSLGIKDANGDGEITKDETLVTYVSNDGGSFSTITYIIDPISDAQVVIEAGVNDFAKDEEGNYKLPVLKTGLVYSGSAQSLVEASAAETVFNSGIEYLVIPSTYEGLVVTDGVPAIPENILGADWKTTAEGLNAGKYYVWARAAAANAGGDDEGNWEAGEPRLLSVAAIEESDEAPANFAEIEKATPTIVWEDKSSVAAKYYKNKFEDGKVIVSPTGAKVQFNGQDLEGAKITYVFKKGSNTLGSILTSTSYTINNSEVGKDYKVIARFSIKDDNVNKNFKQNFKSITGNDDPKATFEIKAMPDVTITPTAPQLIGFGTNPVFTYEGEGGVVWEDGEEGTLEGTAQYRWYRDENCQTRVPTTSTPAEGEYYVKIFEGLTSTTHNIVYKPFKVLVTSGDIEAEIADHTGEDALIYGQPLPLTLEHITGLAEAQVANFESQSYINGEFVAKNKVTGEETPLTRTYQFGRQPLDTALPVGTYTVTATIETAGFQVFVDAGEWEVVAKDITNEDTGTEGLYVYGLGNEFNLVKDYAGAPIIPTGDDLSAGSWGISYRYEKLKFDELRGELIVPGDLEISPVEGKNNINAGTAYFLIRGKGNFTGEKEMAFTIDKAIMNVKPAAGQKWTVGTPEPDYALDVENIQSQLKGKDRAKDDEGNDQETALDITTAAGFKDLTVKRVSNTTVGNHTDALVAYQKVDEETGEIVPADNYEFKFDNANEDLVIEPGTINLKVKDVTVTYAGKDQKPEFDYEFTLADGTTLSDLMKQDGNWQRLITGLNSDEIEWFRDDDEVEMLYNARTYTDFFGCTVPDGTFKATNYTVTLTKNEGTLTIAPAPVTLKAADQGPMELDNVETEFDAVASVYNSETKQGTVIVTGEIYDPIAELAAIQKPAVVKVGENEITLVPSNNSNYDITPQNGTLFVGTKEGDLVLALTSQMEDYEVPVVNLLQNAANSDELAVTAEIKTVTKPGDWSKLKAYEGVPVDMITLQLKPATLSGNADFSAWNADEWHAMVLPFEITVKELSKAFDYAYVNVVDPTATKANDVRFKLANILDVIPANTPFCIKASVPYEYETRTTEGDVTEVTPAQVLEFIPTTTGKTDETKAKFTIDLTGIATEGEGAWTVAGVDADNENLGYKFAGIYDELTIDKDTKDALRFLGTVGGVNKWYYIGDASTKTCTLPPYTGFVNLGAKTADVREVTFTFEEEDGSTTSIKAVDFFNGFNANDEVYTVDGMKVNAPTQKGVYIKNGKKVLVK